MSTSIYDQHDKAFQHVSAFVVVHEDEKVATIAFKLPRDGAGRLYAYVHWLGTPMVRGFAGGYGYDKRSAACADAARRMPGREAEAGALQRLEDERSAFRDALMHDGGEYWNRRLEAAGFDVWQAV